MTSLADMYAGDPNPAADAQQLMSGGVVGQALAKQRQRLQNDDPGSGAQPDAPATPPLPATMPSARIRQGFTLLDPKDWTPEERALFMHAHGITQPQTGIAGLLQSLLGHGAAQAAAPQPQLPQPGIPQI